MADLPDPVEHLGVETPLEHGAAAPPADLVDPEVIAVERLTADQADLLDAHYAARWAASVRPDLGLSI